MVEVGKKAGWNYCWMLTVLSSRALSINFENRKIPPCTYQDSNPSLLGDIPCTLTTGTKNLTQRIYICINVIIPPSDAPTTASIAHFNIFKRKRKKNIFGIFIFRKSRWELFVLAKCFRISNRSCITVSKNTMEIWYQWSWLLFLICDLLLNGSIINLIM